MKKLLTLLCAVFLAVTIASSASAFSLGYNGPLEIKFTNYEMIDIQNQENYGIFSISNIQDVNTNDLWQRGDNGEYLTGVFYGITPTQVTTDGDATTINSVGGHFDIYLNDSNMDATLGTGGYAGTHATYTGITSGSLFLSFDLVVTASGFTVEGTLNNTTGTGSAESFGSVTGGAYASIFDSNDFLGGLADISLFNDFYAAGTSRYTSIVGDWAYKSQDPIYANTIPEPTTLVLLGFGLLGIAGIGRQRKQS